MFLIKWTRSVYNTCDHTMMQIHQEQCQVFFFMQTVLNSLMCHFGGKGQTSRLEVKRTDSY